MTNVERKSSIDTSDGSVGVDQPSSKSLLIKLANDYSQYLKTDLSFQITKVEEFVEESIAKLEEFRSLFEMKENERKTWSTVVLPDLIRTGMLLSLTLKQRLDTLTALITSIQAALDCLEAQISDAEGKLGLPGNATIICNMQRSVFKYFIKEDGNDKNQFRQKQQYTVTVEQLRSSDPLKLFDFFHD